MGSFPRIYSDEQRDAIETAWGDRNIRPAAAIVRLAASGELTSAGELVPAFTVPEQTVRDLGRRFLRRRAGLERSATAELGPRDALERLRRRLVSAADAELERIERVQARRHPADLERLRQVARAVREIAALPSPDEPAPGRPIEAGRQLTRGGLASAILKAGARGASSEAAHEPHEPETHETPAALEPGAGEAGAAPRINGEINGAELERNGSIARHDSDRGDSSSDARAW